MLLNEYFARVEALVRGSRRHQFSSRCLYFHLYYEPSLSELEEMIASDPTSDILFSVVKESPASRTILEFGDELSCRGISYRVYIVDNMGSDVLPFLYLNWLGAFDRYDWICKTHYKKTARRESLGHWWRETMLRETVIDAGQVIRDQRTGDCNLVGPRGLICAHPRFWVDNHQECGRLLRMFDVDISYFPHPFFFAGTSFWLSSQLLLDLRLLFEATIGPHDLRYDSDGTFGHAFERIVALIELGRGRSVMDSRGETYSATEARLQAVPEPIFQAFLV